MEEPFYSIDIQGVWYKITTKGTIMFGELIKKLRSEKRLGLREFCMEVECDPSNWSKVERGILSPPQDPDTLKRIAAVLGISEGSEQWEQLWDYSRIGAGRIPDYVLE